MGAPHAPLHLPMAMPFVNRQQHLQVIPGNCQLRPVIDLHYCRRAMTDADAPTFLAIDGGGTCCRFVLIHAGRHFEESGGSANPSTDFAATAALIIQRLGRVAAQAGLTENEMSAIPSFVGLAGLTGPRIRDRLRGALPLQHARLVDDRPACVQGALGTDDGYVANCGTGSFFAVQSNGRQRFVGGWGPVLGDEASAQWMGRSALSAAACSVDGIIPTSPLVREILARFDDAEGIVEFAGRATPADRGAIAPAVTRWAAADDPLARHLLEAGAHHVTETLRHLGWQPGSRICLVGGLAPHYAALLPDDMQRSIMQPRGRSIDGALALARNHALEVGRALR
ncbi:MAG: ATPase [Rhodobacteraceae bacterium]|nr:ATPase [Paracoccaceae bacterium]